jgi:mono/diheme cytochrome c family protein
MINVQADGAIHPQHWHYPSRAECNTCHTHVAGEALGFNTRQLNGEIPINGKPVNQLQALSDAGYFSQPLTGIEGMPAFVKANDETQSLESRVRSYLAVNCVQCHQPGGVAQGYWDARPTVALRDAQLLNGPLVNRGNDAANRWAVPGDPVHSMVLKRLSSDGAVRMPPLATFELDTQSIDLMKRWIAQLPPAETH